MPATTQKLEAALKSGNPAKFGPEERIPACEIVRLTTRPDANQEFHPKGIRIQGGEIVGKLDFMDATLLRPLHLERCRLPDRVDLRRAQASSLRFDGCVIKQISANGLRTRYNLTITNCQVDQTVSLIGARITGSLDLTGTTIGAQLRPDETAVDALLADSLAVEGDAFFGSSSGEKPEPRDTFTACGSISLRGAKITGDMYCDQARILGTKSTLNGERLSVKGGLFMRGGFSIEGFLNLANAEVGVLFDSADHWPRDKNLLLTGFTYGAIDLESPQDAKRRLLWLNKQDPRFYSPQPYEQLARVLKGQGHELDSRSILIAKEEERLKSGGMEEGWKPFWRLYGRISGFGYLRFQPLRYIFAFIVLGACVFALADRAGIMVPTKERVYMRMKDDPKWVLPTEYPAFQPIIYSADLFLPFVDLAQDTYWLPNAGKSWWGSVARFYMWFHILCGWVLSALFVAGVTGLVKRD